MGLNTTQSTNIDYNKHEIIEIAKSSGEEFAPLNRLASYICDTPVSLINLLDQNFQFTISKFGEWDGDITPKKETVCQFTVQEDHILVINDTLNDERTNSIKEIAGNPALRFYAGVPINSPEGNRLGAFCVIGDHPQELSQKQRQALIDLGQEVEARISLFHQKQLVENQNTELQQSVAFLENSTDIRWILDPLTFKIKHSKGANDIIGRLDAEVTGKSLFDIIEEVNIHNHIKQWIHEKENPDRFGIPVKVATSNDEDIWLDLSFTRYNDKVLATGRDITKQHVAEEQLRESLEEKEILLSEVHHRVKNNLAVIQGLLQLERFQTEDENIIHVLQNSESRITSIAKIHELLYQSNDFANVQLKSYLQELISYLSDSYPVQEDKITIDISVSDFAINVNQALPVGLIVNELITNAIKYAFPDKRPGVVRVLAVEKEDDIITIEVSDNGQGLDIEPEEFEEKGNLGFSLVSTLLNQLDAELNITSEEGTTFRFTFQKEDSKGAVSGI